MGMGILLPPGFKADYALRESIEEDNPWTRRRLLLQMVSLNPGIYNYWQQLAATFVELEEIVMALWVAFIIRRNFPLDLIVKESLKEHMEALLVLESCGSLWCAMASQAVRQSLPIIYEADELAPQICAVFNSQFRISLQPDELERGAWLRDNDATVTQGTVG
jgi:hypothetical protein